MICTNNFITNIFLAIGFYSVTFSISKKESIQDRLREITKFNSLWQIQRTSTNIHVLINFSQMPDMFFQPVPRISVESHAHLWCHVC